MEYHQIKAKAELASRMFKRGAASRQDEADGMQRKLRLIESLRDNQFNHLLEITEQRDNAQFNNRELQNRIDEAIEVFEEHDLNHIEQIEKVYVILKGEQNEH